MRASGAIKNHLHQRFIQRCHKVTKAVDPATITQGLREGLTERNPNVLIGVMVVNVRIAICRDLQIDQAMAADLMQHVIEKGHTSARLTSAAAVKPEPNADIGLACNAVNLPSAHALRRRSTPRDSLDHRE
jgi:hypothetical protein